jgi:DNA-binding NarL/FixJ family response regulator
LYLNFIPKLLFHEQYPCMKKLKILIVDDNSHFVNALRFILLDNFENRIESIYTANDGQDCLNQLRKRGFDLVFMDIDMPNMNGIETTRHATILYRNLIIVAVSFHTEMKFVMQMIEAGARSYIIKDEINRESLEKALSIEYTF